jgi:hypothetical protein
LTLQTKIFNRSQLIQVDGNLKSMLEGLNVKITSLKANSRGWVELGVSGEDEKVAVQYLVDNVGFCPARLEDVHRFSTFKGLIVGLVKGRNELRVDMGISFPAYVEAVVPLYRLQAQLCDGRKIALNKMVELFGFCDNLPLRVRILQVSLETKRVEAELSEEQLKLYAGWTGSLLDRLLILGASFSEVEAALKVSGVNRDVVNVESLGMFEHAVVCKLGTDAVGLVPKVGRILGGAALSVFNPRRILGLLGDGSILPVRARVDD